MGKVTQELKYKRLKVGHACFVCRSKKIKCDGLSPCMQCKARGRQCRPGNLDNTSEQLTVENIENQNNSDTNSVASDDEAILFSWKKDSKKPLPISTNQNWTQNVVHKKGENELAAPPVGMEVLQAHATFGSFIKWTEEPPLPRNYSCPIEMPPSKLQMKMIDIFFQNRYKITPCIPKRYFYEQLRKKGPFITPLLLNTIYCVVCACCPDSGLPKPSVFYNRARKLVDDFLDTPRLSTVIALTFMSLYEPQPTKGEVENVHCRSWIHSGMAYRMCLELGINVDSEHTRNNLPPEEIELRRRVFWFCYCLDKVQSAEWERSWVLPSNMTRVCLPQFLPEDDEEERMLVNYLHEKIKLTLLLEQYIQLRAKLSISKNGILESVYEMLEDFYGKILDWRDNFMGLPKQGIEHCVSVAQVMNLPSDGASLSHLFLLFYTVLLDILFWLPETPIRVLEQRIYSAHVIRCCKNLCDIPAIIMRYEFMAHSLISAIRIQVRYLEDPNPTVSQQSWYYFNQSMELFQRFKKYSVVPELSAIVGKVPALRKYSEELRSSCKKNKSQPLQMFEDLNDTPALDSNPVTNTAESPINNYNTHAETNTFIPTLNFQQPGSQDSPEISITSDFANLSGFNDNIGVDFTHRHQLWDTELQDLNAYNTYDPCSGPVTPDDQLINTQWQDTAPTEFAWSLPVISHQTDMQYNPAYPVYTTDQHLNTTCSASSTSPHPTTPETPINLGHNELTENPYNLVASYDQRAYYQS